MGFVHMILDRRANKMQESSNTNAPQPFSLGRVGCNLISDCEEEGHAYLNMLCLNEHV